MFNIYIWHSFFTFIHLNLEPVSVEREIAQRSSDLSAAAGRRFPISSNTTPGPSLQVGPYDELI